MCVCVCVSCVYVYMYFGLKVNPNPHLEGSYLLCLHRPGKRGKRANSLISSALRVSLGGGV